MSAAEFGRRRHAIFVLGMHRSGTSAMTRTLALAGCTLPRRLMPANFANPAGYWEPLEAAELNEAVLREAGSSWSDIFALRRQVPGVPPRPEHVERARQILRDDYGDADLIVFKDPRASLLVELWRRAARQEGYEPLFVIMVRHPDEVAASLAQREGFARHRSLLLWTTYMLAAERGAGQDKRLFVAFESLIGAPEVVLDRIEEALGVSLPHRAGFAAAQIESFLDPALVHHRDGEQTPLPQPIGTLFVWLEAAARGDQHNTDTPAEVGLWLDGIEGAIGPLLEESEARAAQAQADLAERLASAQAETAAMADAAAQERLAAAARTMAAIAAAEQRRAALTLERDVALDRAALIERDLGARLDAAERETSQLRSRLIALEAERLTLRLTVEREADRAAASENEARCARDEAGALQFRLGEADGLLAQRQLRLDEADRLLAQTQARLEEADGVLTQTQARLSEVNRQARKEKRTLTGRLARQQAKIDRAEEERARLLEEAQAQRRAADEAKHAAQIQAQALEAEAALALERARQERHAVEEARATAGRRIAELDAELGQLRRRTTWQLQAQVLGRAVRMAGRRLGLKRRK